jgi:hypothetical protein
MKMLAVHWRALPIALAGLLALDMAALGANGPLLAMIAANAHIGLLILVLLAGPMLPVAVARGLLVPALLAVGATMWAIYPDMLALATGRASSATVRPAPDLVWPALVQIIAGWSALLSGVWIAMRRRQGRIFIDWLLLFGVLVILLGLILRQWDGDAVWGYAKGIHAGRFTGTLLNANAAGALFAVLAILAFARALVAWMGQKRHLLAYRLPLPLMLSILAFLAALGACLLTGSRAAFLLLVLTLPVVGLVDGTARRAICQRRYLPYLVGCGLLLLALVLLFGGLTLSRLEALSDGQVDRPGIWAHYRDLGLMQPHGFGLGSFAEANIRFLGSPAQAHGFWYINAAHNFVLNMMVEGGWPYAALMLAAAGWMMIDAVCLWRSGGFDVLSVAMACAIVLITLCAGVDIIFNVPAGAYCALVLLGLLWGRSARSALERG